MKKILPYYAAKAFLLTIFLSAFMFLQVKAGKDPFYIKLNGKDTIISEQGRKLADPGAMVYDSTNNVISNADIKVIYPNDTNYIFIPGTYTLTYKYFAAGFVTINSRTVVIIPDTTAPVITIEGVHADSLGNLIDTIGVFEEYISPQATAQDILDGNLSATIMVNSNVNTSNTGIFSIKYSVSDAAGNKTEQTVYVNVVDTIAPVVKITSLKNDTLYLGENIENLASFEVTDNYSKITDFTLVQFGNWWDAFDRNGNAIKPGRYYMGYEANDKGGNIGKDSIFFQIVDSAFRISGNITLSSVNQNFDRNATVYLIKFDGSDSSLTEINKYYIPYGSAFEFYPLQAGNYLIKAALDSADSLYTSYLPTYYDGSLTWDGATAINLSSNAIVNINLLAGTNSGGPGFISGKVSQGANKQEGDPLENIQILLTTKDDKPVAYTYSDKNGLYEFKNLAFGTYKLSGEIAGKKALSGEVTISEAQPQRTDINVIVNSTSVKTSVSEIIDGINEQLASKNIFVYPNPANDKIIIPGNANLINVTLYNTAGLLVKTQIAANGNFVIQTKDIPQGIYFLQLNFNNAPAQREKIVISH
ncbi:MAG: DUF5011 domain-containing protein [Sphingobacteriales bacterium]|nr:MAG: DUF5011 domain-containing protein [Sphingobacteriales bacterium]